MLHHIMPQITIKVVSNCITTRRVSLGKILYYFSYADFEMYATGWLRELDVPYTDRDISEMVTTFTESQLFTDLFKRIQLGNQCA